MFLAFTRVWIFYYLLEYFYWFHILALVIKNFLFVMNGKIPTHCFEIQTYCSLLNKSKANSINYGGNFLSFGG